MQAALPRVLLVPLQVILGVQLHYHYASQLLINTLHQHGSSCSYNIAVMLFWIDWKMWQLLSTPSLHVDTKSIVKIEDVTILNSFFRN